MKTPECDKLVKVSEKSQSIGQFLDWLSDEKRFVICEVDYATEEYLPVSMNIERLLAEYFNIDMEKVEKERRKILDSLQKKAKAEK